MALADLADVHRTFIGHVEQAKTNVSLDNIARISEALEVPAAELLRAGREGFAIAAWSSADNILNGGRLRN